MPSKFGGIAVDDAPKSKFGGIPVGDSPEVKSAPAAKEPPKNELRQYFDNLDSTAGNALKATGHEMLEGAKDVKDLVTMNYPKQPQKDVQGAYLEGYSQNPGGKFLGATRLFPPVAAGSALFNKVINPSLEAILGKTGMNPKNVEVAETLLPFMGRKLPKAEAPGIEAAKSGVKSAAEGVGTMKTGFNARNQEELASGLKSMENKGGNAFNEMRAQKVGLIPQASSALVKHINDSVLKSGILNPTLHGDYIAVIKQMANASKGGLQIEQVHQFRRLLRAAEMKNVATNPDAARVAREAIDALDEGLETIGQNGTSAQGTKAINALNSGIEQWAAARKFETISDIINRSQGDPSKIKNAFKNLLNNKKKMRGFTKEERELIKGASENSTPESLMKMAGRFGFDMSKGVQGSTVPWLAGFGAHMLGASNPLTAGLALTGTGARYGQKMLARGKAEKVLKAIEGRQNKIPLPATQNLNNILANP